MKNIFETVMEESEASKITNNDLTDNIINYNVGEIEIVMDKIIINNNITEIKTEELSYTYQVSYIIPCHATKIKQ